jgi:hypothetical protein
MPVFLVPTRPIQPRGIETYPLDAESRLAFAAPATTNPFPTANREPPFAIQWAEGSFKLLGPLLCDAFFFPF